MKFEMPKTDVTPAANRRTVEIEYAFGETKVIADEVTTERMKRGFGVFLAREVLPGEITLTREEFREAFAKAYATLENANKQLDATLGFAIERVLFESEVSEKQ